MYTSLGGISPTHPPQHIQENTDSLTPKVHDKVRSVTIVILCHSYHPVSKAQRIGSNLPIYSAQTSFKPFYNWLRSILTSAKLQNSVKERAPLLVWRSFFLKLESQNHSEMKVGAAPGRSLILPACSKSTVLINVNNSNSAEMKSFDWGDSDGFLYQFWMCRTRHFFFGRENAQIPKGIFYFWEWNVFRLGSPEHLGMFSLQCNASSWKILSGHFTVCRQDGSSQGHRQHRMGQGVVTLWGLTTTELWIQHSWIFAS